MHLAILTQYYPPEVGAPQARLSELAACFKKRGHNVTVLTAMPNYPEGRIHAGYGGLLRREQRGGVEVIRTFIYPTQRADFARRLTNYFSFVLSSAVAGSLLLLRPDYLMVESPPLFLGLTGRWLSWLKRTKLIFNVSDLWPETAAHLGLLRRESLAYRLSEKIEALCYQRAWLVTGQSEGILASVTKRFPSCSTFHLSNGVDTERFRPDCETGRASEIVRDNGSCVALYAGLHGLAQGLEQVLGSADALRGEPGLRFVLVGDGPEKQRLVQQANERALTNVKFVDSMPAAEMPSLLASADISLVILKTHIPGAVPSKLYEAMACARPVVLVADGEAAAIVTKENAGIVVRPGDVEGLARAINSLRADAGLRRALGENGRRAAERRFDRASIATRFINHLEDNLRPEIRGGVARAR